MKGALAIFVKTVGISPVKTRLVKVLGHELAEEFHLLSAHAVCAVSKVLSHSCDVQGYYAVAEKEALTHGDWQSLPCLWQGEGGLGERMAHIYQALLKKHDFVMLVGADIPQMTSVDLNIGAQWLVHEEQARLVFASSIDGGFWAFGGNCPVPDELWSEVVYSKVNTGSEFLKRVECLGNVKFLSVLRDVDEVTDLPFLHQSLLDLPDPLSEHLDLIKFLESLPVISDAHLLEKSII